jgi:hypothetical protein
VAAARQAADDGILLLFAGTWTGIDIYLHRDHVVEWTAEIQQTGSRIKGVISEVHGEITDLADIVGTVNGNTIQWAKTYPWGGESLIYTGEIGIDGVVTGIWTVSWGSGTWAMNR